MSETPILEMSHPDGRTEKIPILKQLTTIGRAPDNDIVLNYPDISRYHANIEKVGQIYVIKNLSEQNYIKVNNIEIKEHELYNGYIITIGMIVIKFEYELSIALPEIAPTIIRKDEADSKDISGAKTILASSDGEPQKASGKTVLISEDFEVKENIYAALKIKPLNKDEYDVLINKYITTIGRDNTNDIILDDPYVARKQVEISCAQDKKCYIIEDLGKNNKIKINGKFCKNKQALKNGDRIQMGKTLLTYFSVVQEDARQGKITIIPPGQTTKTVSRAILGFVAVFVLFIAWGLITHQPFLKPIPVFSSFYKEDIMIDEVRKLERKGDFENAIKNYEKILSEFPNTNKVNEIRKNIAECYFNIADELINKEKYSEARDVYKMITAKFKDIKTETVEKATQSIIMSYYKEAEKAKESKNDKLYTELLKTIIKEYPTSSLANDAKSILGKTKDKTFLLGEMQRCLNKKLYINPPEANLIKYYNDFKNNFPDDNACESFIEKAREEIKNEIDKAFKEKNEAEAEKWYSLYFDFESNFRMIENDEKAVAYKKLGKSAKSNGLLEQAEKYINKALEFKGGKDKELENLLNEIKKSMTPDEDMWFKKKK